MRNLVTGSFVALIVAAVSMPAFSSARAEDCPGNPDALGTTRVLTIDPSEYPHVGLWTVRRHCRFLIGKS